MILKHKENITDKRKLSETIRNIFSTTGNVFFLLLCVSYRIVLVSDRIALVFVRESESMRGISKICNVV